MSRQEVVAACVAASETRRVSVRPWRFEVALGQAAEMDSPVGDVVRDWVQRGAAGTSASGLESALAGLCRTGALVYSRVLRCFVVDPWWREQHRAHLNGLDEPSQTSITLVASELDRLEFAEYGR